MNLASLVLPLQNLAHFANAAPYGSEERLLEFLFDEHGLKNCKESLRRDCIHLCDMEDAVGERLHGNLEVVSLELVLSAVNQLTDSAFLVLLYTEHVQLDQIHDFQEFCAT